MLARVQRLALEPIRNEQGVLGDRRGGLGLQLECCSLRVSLSLLQCAQEVALMAEALTFLSW